MTEKTWCVIAFAFVSLATAFWAFATRWSAGFMANPPSEHWLPLARHLFCVALIFAFSALISSVALIIRVRWVLQDVKRNVPVRARRSFIACTTIVAASTFLFPVVTGYGTILYQWIVLGSWALIAKATSGQFANHHHGAMWILAFFLNVGVFLVPATVIWAISSRRLPRTYVAMLTSWMLFYLASLFILFPATDGP
ncbi:MAG: hypothetical protein Q8N18_08595 [Opitutaceae bacterium]|nr:hypothetical protein [Opitutaceae bacterium]